MAGDELDNAGGPAAGEGAGDSAAADAAHTETPGSDSAGESDAAVETQRARDEYIADVASKAAAAVVERFIRDGQQAPAAGNPPTPAASGIGALEAERQSIIAEVQALDAAIRRDGVTGELLLRRSDLSDRKSEFVAKVNMHAMKMQETAAAVSSRGNEDEWRRFANDNPTVPVDILRDAFEKRAGKAAPAASPATIRPKPVDASGGGERGAATPKVPTITMAQFDDKKAQLRAAGMHDEAAKLDRQVRAREVLLKG